MSDWRNLNKGDRIRLIKMDTSDPDPIEPGAEGTVEFVNDLTSMREGFVQIGVDWDNGRSLMLVERDEWEKIDG